MLPITVQSGRVHIGHRFSVSFQRTKRAGPEGVKQPFPSRGQLPALLVSNSPESGSQSSELPTVFAPCGPDEAVWLGFADAMSEPVALKIRVGSINAVTGFEWDDGLHDYPMDYLVPPDQTSWHGIRLVDAVHQFGEESLELVVYEPIRPVAANHAQVAWDRVAFRTEKLDGGGRRHDPFPVIPDRYGIAVWSDRPDGRVTVSFVDLVRWRLMTGEDPPEPSSEYRGHRLP